MDKMTGKDPKDMTASELLRKVDRHPCSMCHLVMAGEESCATTACESWAYRLADKVDAELAQATAYGISEGFNSSLRAGAELWAKANGWPDFRDGDDFGQWLDRCALPRPCYENGEPVQFGDSFLRWDGKSGNDGEKVTEITVRGGDCYRWSLNGDCCTSQLVKRPAPEVLGADGLPVVAGEEVWSLSGTGPHTVGTVYTDIQAPDGRDCPWADIDNDGTWACVESLTHTPPETQARIDDDATLHPRVYYAEHIGHDVDLKDDAEVTEAMVRDLLRRQRELDKRKGGAE